MKCCLVLAYAYSFAAVAYHEVRSARIGLLGSHIYTPRFSSDLISQSQILSRRGDSPKSPFPKKFTGSSISSEKFQSEKLESSKPDPIDKRPGSPTRFGSPRVRSKVAARGPADMHTQDSRGRRQEQVPGDGNSGMMRSVDQSHTAAWGRSVGREQSGQPRAQQITLAAKGRSVYGRVQPPFGSTGTGTIEVHSNQGEGNVNVHHVPSDGRHAHIHSSHPGGALVKATADHGGLAVVTATNERYGDPRVPKHLK